MAETILYQQGNVAVTSTQVAVSDRKYPLADVTSARKSHPGRNEELCFWLVVVGLIMTVIGFWSVLFSGSINAVNTGTAIVGVLLIVVAIILLFAWRTYAVVLVSPSRRTSILKYDNEAEIDRIVAAINNAIAHRG